MKGEELYLSYIITCILNAFLSYTAITLNCVTIHALRKTSSLPKPLKTLLLSLAASDLGVGLLVQPLNIATVTAMLLKQNTENSATYNNMYMANLTLANVFTIASFFGVMALSADRFLAVHLHLRYQELVTHKRVVAVVISIWVFSAVLSFVRLLIEQNISYVIFGIIAASCLLTTTTLYYKIYKTVRHHVTQITVLQVQQVAQNGEIETDERQRKFFVGTFIVYLAFLVCYLPNLCIIVAFAISGPSTTINGLQLYTLTLVFLNSSLNPLIYCWKMRHIRHAVINILRNILRSHK